jgi:hypothetical protein
MPALLLAITFEGCTLPGVVEFVIPLFEPQFAPPTSPALELLFEPPIKLPLEFELFQPLPMLLLDMFDWLGDLLPV